MTASHQVRSLASTEEMIASRQEQSLDSDENSPTIKVLVPSEPLLSRDQGLGGMTVLAVVIVGG